MKRQKTEVFTLRLTPQHLEKLRFIADAFQMTESNVLRNLIENARIESLPVVSAAITTPINIHDQHSIPQTSQ